MAHSAIKQNATIAQDQAEYQVKYDKLMKRYEDTKTAYENTAEEIESRKSKASTLSNFAKSLRKQENILENFDEGLWGTLVENMTVPKTISKCFSKIVDYPSEVKFIGTASAVPILFLQ